MQTVQFNCPHCNNPMAVGLNLLGRNVRCPHCKAVIQAPASANAPAPTPPAPPKPEAPAFQPTRQEYDSIFGETHDEDVFGSRKKASSVEMPAPDMSRQASVRRPLLGAADSVVSMPVVKPEMIFTTDTESMPVADAPPMRLPMQQPPTFESLPDAQESGLTDDFDPVSAPPEPRGRPARPKSPKAPARASGIGNALTVGLLLYAALMTAGVAWLALKPTKGAEPAKVGFEAIPDVMGDFEKADRKSPVSFRWMPDPAAPLPASQRVAMGQTRKFGSLEVTPTMLEFRRLDVVRRPKDEKESVQPAGGLSLVLTLKLRNVSPDIVLYPNDPAFNRRFHEKTDDVRPYNSLTFNNQKTNWGGMIRWPQAEDSESTYIKGQENDRKPLLPGEERETIVFSQPGAEVHKLVESDRQKPVLWRVQLRNDLLGSAARPVSTTTVIGVEFRGVDVQF